MRGIADNLAPLINQQPGCQQVLVFGDDGDGEYGLLVLWDSQENADAAAEVIRPRLNEHLAGHVKQPPDARLFTVVT